MLNAKMKVVPVENIPTLCLFSVKDIHGGEEVLYDYGEKDYPWLMVQGNKVYTISFPNFSSTIF